MTDPKHAAERFAEFQRERSMESFDERACRCLEELRELDDLTQYLHEFVTPQLRAKQQR